VRTTQERLTLERTASVNSIIVPSTWHGGDIEPGTFHVRGCGASPYGRPDEPAPDGDRGMQDDAVTNVVTDQTTVNR